MAVLAVAPPAASTPGSISVTILLDLGDGAYVWSHQAIEDPQATNATWDAVRRAAEANGIPIESGWHPTFGVGIFDLGDRNPPAGFVGIFEWNRTSAAWTLAGTGISGLVLREGDSIALYNAAFAPTPPYATRTPVPSPDHALPSLGFRRDASNSGVAHSPIPSRVRVAWDRDLGVPEIGSTPAVAYGRVFVSTLHRMVALDAETGAILWTNPKGRGFSSPAVYNDSVYVGTSAGTVVRLNGSDGAVIWETRLLTDPGFTGISSSPKVVFEHVFIGTFNETGGPGEVVALWEGTGEVAWRHSTGSIHFSTPGYAGGRVYAGVMGRYNTTTQITFDPPYGVLALDATTGAKDWFFETLGSVAASPTIAGDRILAPAKDGRIYALNRTTGDLVWSSKVDAGVSSPAVIGDRIFVGGGAFGQPGRVVALDLRTGALAWSFVPNGPVQASLTYAKGRILFATNTDHGRVYAIEAATGDLAWSYEPVPAQYILGSPVPAEGRVYAPSDNGHLTALEDAGPDTMKPSITIASPTSGAVLGTATVEVSGSASDDVEVDRVELSTDRTTWIPATGTSTWSGTVSLREGANTIFARATDTSGNNETTSIVVSASLGTVGGIDPVTFTGLLVVASASAVAFAAWMFIRRRRRVGP